MARRKNHWDTQNTAQPYFPPDHKAIEMTTYINRHASFVRKGRTSEEYRLHQVVQYSHYLTSGNKRWYHGNTSLACMDKWKNNPAIAPSSSQIHYTQTFVVVSDPIAGQKSAQSGDIRQCLCPTRKTFITITDQKQRLTLSAALPSWRDILDYITIPWLHP